jgi:hypothetical protein
VTEIPEKEKPAPMLVAAAEWVAAWTTKSKLTATK